MNTNMISNEQLFYLRNKKLHKLYITWSRALLFFGFLTLWQIASNLQWIDSFYFSSPLEILSLFLQSMQDMTLPVHIGITLFESTISFLLIILLSLCISTLFWFLPSFGSTLEPFLIMLNSLPKSALAPLIIVWLGTGPKTIILCGISVGLFGCILNLYQHFAQTDPERLKLIQTLGGNRFQTFTKVVFPSCIPAFLSIAKVNIGLALVGVIIGEFLAGKQGLGYLILYSSQTFRLSNVLLCIIILCIIALFLYWILTILEQKISKNFN